MMDYKKLFGQLEKFMEAHTGHEISDQEWEKIIKQGEMISKYFKGGFASVMVANCIHELEREK